jgi:hypothetical protein
MLFNEKGVQAEEEKVPAEALSLIFEQMLKDNLTDEEKEEFINNVSEVNECIREGIITEKTIVRLDPKAKLSKRKKIAIYTIAREKDDPLFKKLLTVWRLERHLQARLTKKYGMEGTKRAKKAASQKSSSPTVKRAQGRSRDLLKTAQGRKVMQKRIKDTTAKQLVNRLK